MQFFGWVMGLTLATVSVAEAKGKDFLEFIPVVQDQRIVRRGVFEGSAPRFEQLKKITAKTYEDFLNEVFQIEPSFANNYVLVHGSESQQFSSLEHPRVLVYGSGVVLAVSDHPGQADKRIEIMQADPSDYKISLHEIIFRAQGGVEFVEKPASCIACHGSPAKPLWNPYDFWPNTFGSAIGLVGTQQEEDAYQRLRKNAADSPILRHLNLPKKMKPPEENVTAFTQFVHILNLGRWTNEKLKNNPAFDMIAEPLLATLSYCTSPTRGNVLDEKLMLDYLHPEDRQDFKIPYSLVLQDTVASRDHFKNFLDRSLERIFPGPQHLFKVDHARLSDEVTSVAQMRWLFDLAGIDTSNLSTSLIGNDSIIASPSNAPLDFILMIYEARPDVFRNLKWDLNDLNLQAAGAPAWIMMDCEDLLAKSAQKRRQFAERSTWQSYKLVTNERPVISRCAKCHSEGLFDPGNPAPKLPFEQPMKLSERLRSEKNLMKRMLWHVREARGTTAQMPPDKALSDEEITALTAYLENLLQ